MYIRPSNADKLMRKAQTATQTVYIWHDRIRQNAVCNKFFYHKKYEYYRVGDKSFKLKCV